ncbi:hypothetical protein ACLMJK_005643 [Lecanora helva]
MESLAALGLAANIVQFLDFGRKLVSGTLELCRSEDGTSSAGRALQIVTEDLNKLCIDLSQHGHSAYQSTNGGEAGLFELADSCKRLGQELIQRLNSLKVKGANRRWKSFRQLLKSIWHAEEVSRYEKQLNHYRSQIALRLLTILGEQQQDICTMQSNLLEQQRTLRQALDRLAEDHARLDINSVNKPKELTDILVTTLGHLKLQQPRSRQTLPQFRPAEDEHDIESEESNASIELPHALAGWLKDLQSDALTLNDQIEILESLQFPQIFERVENIKYAHDSTFEWLFDETEDYLESSEDSIN